jgi:hypothetical protein
MAAWRGVRPVGPEIGAGGRRTSSGVGLRCCYSSAMSLALSWQNSSRVKILRSAIAVDGVINEYHRAG